MTQAQIRLGFRLNLIGITFSEMLALCELTVSQERGFGSNHLVFLKARPQHATAVWPMPMAAVPVEFIRVTLNTVLVRSGPSGP